SWESLAFQPRFTATAANVAYGWWSHDIGGGLFWVEQAPRSPPWGGLGASCPTPRLPSHKNTPPTRRRGGAGAQAGGGGARPPGHAAAPRAHPVHLLDGLAQHPAWHPARHTALLLEPGAGGRLQLPAGLLVRQRAHRRSVHRAADRGGAVEPSARVAARGRVV